MFTFSQIRQKKKKKKTAQFWVLKNASANQSMSNRTANTALTPYFLKLNKLCSFITKIYDLLFTVHSFPPPKLFSFDYRQYTQIFTSWTSSEVICVAGGTKKDALLPLFVEAVVTDYFAS